MIGRRLRRIVLSIAADVWKTYGYTLMFRVLGDVAGSTSVPLGLDELESERSL